MTGIDGNATIHAQVPFHAQRFAFRPMWPGKMTGDYPYTPDVELAQRIKKALKTYSLDSYKWVDLQPTVDTYSVEMIAYDSTRATGTLQRADGTVDKCGWRLSVRGRINSQVINGNGAVDICGLKRGVANEVYLLRECDGRVLRMEVTDVQSAGETCDLGIIPAPEVATGGRIKCTLTDDCTWKSHPLDMRQALAVVSIDGTSAFEVGTTFGTAASLQAPLISESEAAAAKGPWFVLPAGTYYIGPGSIIEGGGRKLWDLVRSGRQADLESSDHPGILKVTVVAKQDQEVALDLTAAAKTIASLAGED